MNTLTRSQLSIEQLAHNLRLGFYYIALLGACVWWLSCTIRWYKGTGTPRDGLIAAIGGSLALGIITLDILSAFLPR